MNEMKDTKSNDELFEEWNMHPSYTPAALSGRACFLAACELKDTRIKELEAVLLGFPVDTKCTVTAINGWREKHKALLESIRRNKDEYCRKWNK